MKHATLLLGTFLSFVMQTSRAHAAIYGDDSRKEAVADISVTEQALRATAILVPRRSFDLTPQESGDLLKLRTFNIDDRHKLCEADRFGKQPAPGFCAAFLVGPDIMVTAGHCINSASLCQNTAVLFDFVADSAGKVPTSFKNDQVFLCEEIIASRTDVSTGIDVSVFRLDRSIMDRKPFTINSLRTAEKKESVHALGFPYGGPAKVIEDAVVRRVAKDQSFFVANIDGFVGNAGSPVFSKEQALLGFIVRGDQNLKESSAGGCFEQPKCRETQCRGEDVLSLNAFRDLVPHQGPHLNAHNVRWSETSGNMNDIPEPGEAGSLQIDVTNMGQDPIKQTSLTLIPQSSRVSVKSNVAYLESIEPTETATITIANVSFAKNIACDKAIFFRLAISNDTGSSSKPIELDLGTLKALDYVIQPEETLAEYLPQGKTFKIPVNKAPNGRKVLISVNIEHERPQQLIMTAMAPDKTFGYLYKLGLSSESITSQEPLVGTFGGTLTPFNDVTPFRHVNKRGDWIITLKDVGQGSAATVHELGVQIQARECAPSP